MLLLALAINIDLTNQPMKVAIHGRSTAPENIPRVVEILDFLERQGVELCVYEHFFELIKSKCCYTTYCNSQDIPSETAFMLSMGGDGTFLDAARFSGERNIPLIGINIGRLGFLAYISSQDAEASLSQILAGEYELEKRSTLRVVGGFIDPKHSLYALNEVSIQRKEPSLIELAVAIDGEPLVSYWSDGLIVATPTGSTAYSMSAGGPIVSPLAANLILSPLAPHNLTIRPIIIPDSSVVTCKVHTRSEKAMVTIDNQMFDINDGAELIIEKSPFVVRLIKLNSSSFYRTLRNKLHWGIDPRC